MKCYNNSGLKLKPTKTSPQLIEKKKSFAFLRLALTGPKLFSAHSMCCLPVFLPDVQKRLKKNKNKKTNKPQNNKKRVRINVLDNS